MSELDLTSTSSGTYSLVSDLTEGLSEEVVALVGEGVEDDGARINIGEALKDGDELMATASVGTRKGATCV